MQKNTCLFSGFKFPLGNPELLNIPASARVVLGGERKCWDRNELLLEWVFLDHKILC